MKFLYVLWLVSSPITLFILIFTAFECSPVSCVHCHSHRIQVLCASVTAWYWSNIFLGSPPVNLFMGLFGLLFMPAPSRNSLPGIYTFLCCTSLCEIRYAFSLVMFILAIKFLCCKYTFECLTMNCVRIPVSWWNNILSGLRTYCPLYVGLFFRSAVSSFHVGPIANQWCSLMKKHVFPYITEFSRMSVWHGRYLFYFLYSFPFFSNYVFFSIIFIQFF